MAAVGPGAGLRPAVLGCIEVVMVSRFLDQLGLNIRHYRVDAIQGQGFTLGQFATLMGGVVGPVYKPAMGTQATYLGTLVRIVGIGASSPAAWDTVGTGVGTAIGDMMAKQTCGLLGFTTAFAGRGNRGRTYVPFPTESQNDPTGVPAAAYQALLDTIAQMWMGIRIIAGPDGGTSTPVLFHKREGSMSTLLAYIVRTKWATQRRRGDYGRVNPVGGGPISLGTYKTSDGREWGT